MTKKIKTHLNDEILFTFLYCWFLVILNKNIEQAVCDALKALNFKQLKSVVFNQGAAAAISKLYVRLSSKFQPREPPNEYFTKEGCREILG